MPEKAELTAEKLMTRDKEAVAPTLDRYTQVAFSRAEGVYLYDIEGKKYLDFSSGIAVMNVGHSHPKVVEAICDQAHRFTHISYHMGYIEPYVELLEELKAVAPGRLKEGKGILMNSGSEAVETALKLARYVTRSPMVIAFSGSFHGRPMGALSCTTSNVNYRRRLSALLNGVYHTPYPYCYRCPLGHKSPQSCGLACLGLLEYAFKTALPSEDVAAVLVEPVAGEGGYIVPPAGFLEGLRRICNQHGILLMVDEIQSGMGRTGKMFAIEHWPEVEPDVLILGKAIGGGLPLAAVLAQAKLMDKWPPGAHGSTFGGNPVACRAGTVSLRIIQEEKLAENAAALGEHIKSRFREAQKELKVIGDVRGLGLMIGIELVERDGQPASGAAKQVIQKAAERGLIMTKCGASTLRIVPPLIIKKEQVDEGVDIILEILRTLAMNS